MKITLFGADVSRVLIVAKCIVNVQNIAASVARKIVLIVAKCIVNKDKFTYIRRMFKVLIVAKCIVNEKEK